MKIIRNVLIVLAVFAVITGIAVLNASETTADKDYVVYYVIQDERLTVENYSIDCEGIYVTNSYVFFKTITGNGSTQVGTLPSTHNIVSRYVSTDLLDDGYVVNPEGNDVSGWFTESTFENKISPTSTMSTLDSDGDGVVYLYMKAARVYQVHYEARNFMHSEVQSPYWYDGHYLEKNHYSGYDRGHFEEVEYMVELIEGQTVPNTMADTDVLFSPGGTPYSSLAEQAGGRKDKSSYNMDAYTVGVQENVHWFLRDNVPDYPNVDVNNCTPVYPGLTVSSALDPDDDGIVTLYGTSTKEGYADAVWLFFITFAQEDLLGRNYGDDGYDGMTENIVLSASATKNGSRFTQNEALVFDLNSYAGFYYSGPPVFTSMTGGADATSNISVAGNEVTITGTEVFHNVPYYHVGVVFKYHRESVQITVSGEDSETVTGYYGRDIQLPSTFASHTLYEWVTSGLSNNIWSYGVYYYYTVSLADLDAVNPSITATWQEGSPETIYTLVYHSRVDGSAIVPTMITNDGFISLPMITCEGYSHLGWALVDPDELIDYDTSTLVIYPGRTTFTPSSVSSEYKTVPDGEHPNLITIHMYAVWCTTYSIVFDANGGDGSMDPIGPINVTEYVSLPANTFTRNNYEFVGWAVSPSGTVAYADMASVIGLSTQSHDQVTLYAIWSSNSYFVVFDGNNATSGSMASESVDKGDPVTLIANEYARTGYIFSGWSTTRNGPLAYEDEATFTPDSSVSLFAIWTPITYYIEFNANGGEGSMSRMEVQYDQSAGLTHNTFTNGLSTFHGWACSDGNTYSNGFMIRNLTAENGATVTMYAIWSQYYIQYNANNGSGHYDTVTVTMGAPYTIPADEFSPGQVGEIFMYWCTTNDGTGDRYYVGDVVTEDLAAEGQTFMLYAYWESYVYYIAFDANGGTGTMETIEVHGEQTVTLTNEFTCANHHFLGWAKNPQATVALYHNGQTVSEIGTGEYGETITLYAIWSEKVVTVTVSGLKYVDNGNLRTLGDISGELAFGTAGDILTHDLLTLTLGSTYSSYSEYRYNDRTFYLTTWHFTIDEENYSDAYGSVLYIAEGVETITITAEYMEFRGYFRYNINNGSATDPIITTIGLERDNGRYIATDNLSDCPFVFEGYQFCMWSRSANSISDPTRAESLYQYNSDSAEQYYDFYAVWIKIEVTGTYHYTGQQIIPTYTVTAVYGTTESVLTPSTVIFENNVNVGTATMTVTLSLTYLSESFSQVFFILPEEGVTIHYILVDGRGGSSTVTGDWNSMSGIPFPTVTPNSGYSFHEWVKVTMVDGRIVAMVHVTYSQTLLESQMETGCTYMAIYTKGDSISFNSNGGTGSMNAQEFTSEWSTLSANTFTKNGYVFLGWSLTSDGPVVYTDRTPLFRISGLSTSDNQNVLYAVWAPYTYTSVVDWNADGEPDPMQMMLNNGDMPMNAEDIMVEAVISDKEGIGLILRIGAVTFALVCAAGAAMIISRRK